MFECLKAFIELGQAFALPAWDTAHLSSRDCVHCSRFLVARVLPLALLSDSSVEDVVVSSGEAI